MKKSFFFVAALVLTFAACNKNGEVDLSDPFIGTFEEAAISPKQLESTFTYSEDGTYVLKSGNFKLQQLVAYDGSYVSGAVVSNQTTTSVENGYADAYKSAKGGAYSGRNFVVWYYDKYAPATLTMEEETVLDGMYVCNTALAAYMIENGDGMSDQPGGFGDNDWFKLTIGGKLNGVAVNEKVEIMLAEGGYILKDWVYLDLSKLGSINELTFEMTGTKTNQYGLTTPTYFCIDNLGAKKD
jgi:hypothetical protein